MKESDQEKLEKLEERYAVVVELVEKQRRALVEIKLTIDEVVLG